MLSLVRNSTGDLLTKSFEYTLPNTASYIKERHQSSWTPLGSQIYSPDNVKLIRFTLSDGTRFLDPSTVRLAFTLNNTHASNELKLAGPPEILFSRARLLIKGTPVEDIQDANRLSLLLNMFDTKERQEANLPESFWTTGIAANKSRRMVMPLNIFGLFRAFDKHISLYWAPLTIELSLAPAAEVLKQGTVSNTYSLSEVQILCDTLSVSGELLKLFSDHMETGSMPFAISSWVVSRHELPASTKFDIQTTRNLSLLKTVFVSFECIDSEQGVASDANNEANDHTNITWFHNPAKGAALAIDTDKLEWQLCIDSRVWPVWPVRSTSDTWYHLRQALDQNRYGASNVSAEQFTKGKYVIGIDIEKGASMIDGASFTGHPCRSGSPITIKFRDFPDASTKTKTAFIYLCHDVIINVTQAGVESLE